MSRFLGPIHYWLFNKIELFEDLEANIVDGLVKIYGEDIQAISEEKQSQYGTPVLGQDLEQIIDQTNIHGWLQNKIKKAETRQAAILEEVFTRFGEEAIKHVSDICAEHGRMCGQDAQRNKNVDSAQEIYKALNDFMLDGMPCDNVNRITSQDADKVEWEHSECLHIGFWQDAQVTEPVVFYELRRVWIESFVVTANPEFKYQFASDNGVFKHAIFRG